MSLAERWERQARILRKGLPSKDTELVLETFITATQRAVAGELTEATAREMLNRILEITDQSPLKADTAEDFLRSWAESKSKSRADGTGKRYTKTAESFIEFIGEKKAKLSLGSISSRDVEGYRDLQITEGKKETTANVELKSLRAAFNIARRQGIILINPADTVDLLDGQSEERSPFSVHQVKAMLDKATDEWRGLILTGLCTGLRIGRASKLTWESIDLERETILTDQGKRQRGKKKKMLENVLLPDLKAYLVSIPKEKRKPELPLFPTLSQIRPGGCRGLSLLFQDIMHSAGVYARKDEREIKGKGRRFNDLTFHSLRHTYISFMANKGVKKEIRKKLAGHTTNVHDRYTHFELETLRNMLREFPSVLDPQQPSEPEK